MSCPRGEWVIVDADAGTASDEWCADWSDAGVTACVQREVLRGGKQEGVERLSVTCGDLTLLIVPTRGMAIERVEMRGRPEMKLAWESPVRGLVHPALVPLMEPGGLGWLDGFSEWFVRCGLESNGAPEWDDQGRLKYPLHGRISNIPACRMSCHFDAATQELVVTGTMRESRIFFTHWELTTTYRIKAGESRFSITDVVKNCGAVPHGFQMLYHINTGVPIAGAESPISVPFERLAPRTPAAAANLSRWNTMPTPDPVAEENVYFIDPATDADGQSLAILAAPDRSRGVAIGFSKRQCPCFSLWKCWLPGRDGFVVGLEPATNFPNPHSVERSHGRVVTVAPNESYTISLDVELLTSRNAVTAAQQRIDDIQKTAAGTILSELPAEWQ